MSQLASLLARFKDASADRVIFAPNEQGYALEGDGKRALPGGPVRDSTLFAAVSEVLSNDDIRGLSSTRSRTIRHEHEGEEYVLEIIRQGNAVALGIRSASKQGGRVPPAPPSSSPSPVAGTAAQPARNRTPDLDLQNDPKRRPTVGAILAQGAPTASAIELDFGAAPITPKPQEPFSMDAVVKAAHCAARDAVQSLSTEIARIASDAAAREVAARGGNDDVLQRAVIAAREAARDAVRDLNVGAPTGGGAKKSEPRVHRSQPAKIDGLLREMMQRKASDLHLTTNAHPVMRVDGEIHFGTERSIFTSDGILEMLREIFTAKAEEDFANLRDADFAYEIPGLARFRINAFEDREGVGAVMRQIPIEVITAEKLGLPKACLDMCWLSKGLVLVTGPTGSGKSTTLAAMVDFINKNRNDHIITIEDPVEFVHKNQKCLVNQREVGQHTKSFKSALRAALREDPDIVLVGEMRDLETIAIAIETAETGHLVFGTLHTTTAISTIDRIIDQFPSDRQEQIRVMLSESLKGVVAQVLCPKIGGGRVAAHEILLGTTAVAAMIREGKTFQLTSTMQTSKGAGMVTMNDSLFALVQKKQVEPKQAYIKAVDKTGFANMLKAANIPLAL